jgi:phosphatidate cytidylyltransferase
LKEFPKRSISGLLFATVLLGALVLGPWSFALLFGVFSVFILREFYQLSKSAGVSPQKNVGLAIGGLIFLSTFLFAKGIISINMIGIYLALLFVVPAFELYRSKKNSLENIAITLFGILYVTFSFSLFIFLVFPDFPHGNEYNPTLLLFLFILIWAYDTGAYLFGITFGKHRLFERISPKKSWEGFFGGWFLSLFLAFAMHRLFPYYGLPFMLLMATTVTITGTYGDLVESMIKRNLGLKDSGKFMPGHGGLLDRFDSILFASPFVYLVVQFFG